MDTKIKKKWIKALRSGKFKQTDGRLRLDEKGESSYCCLGVLCEITNSRYFADSGLPSSYQLYRKFKLRPGEVEDLASMNDNGRSFKYIANYIEREL